MKCDNCDSVEFKNSHETYFDDNSDYSNCTNKLITVSLAECIKCGNIQDYDKEK